MELGHIALHSGASCKRSSHQERRLIWPPIAKRASIRSRISRPTTTPKPCTPDSHSPNECVLFDSDQSWENQDSRLVIGLMRLVYGMLLVGFLTQTRSNISANQLSLATSMPLSRNIPPTIIPCRTSELTTRRQIKALGWVTLHLRA